MRLQCKRNEALEVWVGIINFCGHEVNQRAFNNKCQVYLRKNWVCKCARKISKFSNLNMHMHTYIYTNKRIAHMRVCMLVGHVVRCKVKTYVKYSHETRNRHK